MNQRLFQTLADWLHDGPVVLASVIQTRGATPRKRGSRMLISAEQCAFSIGGGLAEARVIEAARQLLNAQCDGADVAIDLSGRPGAAGICGGQMKLALKRWQSPADAELAQQIATELAQGKSCILSAERQHSDLPATLQPHPRLLIVGAGHCAAALCEIARALDFDIWVYDSRDAWLQDAAFARVNCLRGSADALRVAFETERSVLVVLLNRDFSSDIAALSVIADLRTTYLGMMGSHKRIAQVLTALPQHPDLAQRLSAPIGIEIGAETPHEIAISILAELIRHSSAQAESKA